MRFRSRPVEVEAMLWDGLVEPHRAELPGQYSAESIVAWVNANGGEARYVPLGENTKLGWSGYPRIAVHTINGWAHAAPGHYVVMGDATFERVVEVDPASQMSQMVPCRDFYPCDPETFERRWEPAS